MLERQQMEIAIDVRQRMNALDGWQRLGLVLGCALALIVVLHSLIDGRHPYVKSINDAIVPWYGIAWSTDTIDCARYRFADLLRDCQQFATPVQAEPEQRGNIFDQFDAPSAPTANAFVEIATQYYDLRVVLTLAVPALVLPSLLVALARWISAGFRRRDHL